MKSGFYTKKNYLYFFRKQDVLTIENFNDLLADEVLDFIIIHHSLFNNRKKRRGNIQTLINTHNWKIHYLQEQMAEEVPVATAVFVIHSFYNPDRH